MDLSLITCATCRTKNRVPYVAAEAPRCQQCEAFMPWVTEADDSTWKEVSDSSNVVVVVDLWAIWSPPCKTLSPTLERIAAERAGRMKLVRVNVEDARKVQSKLDGRMIPTTIVMARGEEVARQSGSPPVQQLRRWIDQALAQGARLIGSGVES